MVVEVLSDKRLNYILNRINIIKNVHANYLRSVAWYSDKKKRKKYNLVDEEFLKTRKKSDTIFIFGSGYSINKISKEEWTLMSQHNTMAFNLFVNQNSISIDYHVMREIGENIFKRHIWIEETKKYINLMENNKFYKNTILLMQKGFRAIGPNRVIMIDILSKNRAVFRFENWKHNSLMMDFLLISRAIFRFGNWKPSFLKLPSKSFKEKIVHGPSTLIDCINIAYILGWKTIVLVGVDLNDRRYFWLKDDETIGTDTDRGAIFSSQHATAKAVIDFIQIWQKHFLTENIEIKVYNPRSLLNQVLPVFSFSHEI